MFISTDIEVINQNRLFSFVYGAYFARETSVLPFSLSYSAQYETHGSYFTVNFLNWCHDVEICVKHFFLRYK